MAEAVFQGENIAFVQLLDKALWPGIGGMAEAVSHRLLLMAELYPDASIVMLATSFDTNAVKKFEDYRNRGLIPEKTKLLTFHEDFLMSKRSVKQNGRRTKFGILWLWTVRKAKEVTRRLLFRETVLKTKEKNGTLRRYYRNGQCVREELTRNRKLLSVEVFNRKHPTELLYRDTYFTQAARVKKREYFGAEGKTDYLKFYDYRGKPKFSTWVSTTGFEHKTVMFNHGNPRQFSSTRALKKHWVESIIKTLPEKRVVLFVDQPKVSFGNGVQSAKTRILSTIHTTHREHPQENAQVNFKHWFGEYQRFRDNVDLTVAFTEGQRQDLITDLPESANRVRRVVHKVTHTHQVKETALDGQPRTRDFVVLARMDKMKQIDHVIDAFALILKDHSEAELDIYGSGPAQTELEMYVKSLGLDAKITFKGHIDNPMRVLSEYRFFVTASRFEGFGLTLLESLSSGTPVITYAAPYGPLEMIQNGYNGFTAKLNSVTELAEKMSQGVSTSSTDFLKMSESALTSSERYSEEQWRRSWSETIAELVN